MKVWVTDNCYKQKTYYGTELRPFNRIREIEPLKATYSGPLEYLAECKKMPENLMIRIGHLMEAPDTWSDEKFGR